LSEVRRRRTVRAGGLGAIAVAAAVLALVAPQAMAAGGTYGIDVSRFNGAIDWERVSARTVIRFAFAAASRGSGSDCAVKPRSCGADPRYAANHAGARTAGIRVGPYHRGFVDGSTLSEIRTDAVAEASVFVSQVGAAGGLRRGDLRPALDVETPFGTDDPPLIRTWIRVWLRRVGGTLGVKPLLYTNPVSWRATGNTHEFARLGHLLWIANWGVRRPSVPARSWLGRGWAVWQYTSSGRVKGIRGRVDLNRLGVRFRRIAMRRPWLPVSPPPPP